MHVLMVVKLMVMAKHKMRIARGRESLAVAHGQDQMAVGADIFNSSNDGAYHVQFSDLCVRRRVRGQASAGRSRRFLHANDAVLLAKRCNSTREHR